MIHPMSATRFEGQAALRRREVSIWCVLGRFSDCRADGSLSPPPCGAGVTTAGIRGHVSGGVLGHDRQCAGSCSATTPPAFPSTFAPLSRPIPRSRTRTWWSIHGGCPRPRLSPQQTGGDSSRVGEIREINFVMQPIAARMDTVSVTASRVSFDRAHPGGGTGTLISESQLEHLPTLNRDLYDFLRLVPQISTRSACRVLPSRRRVRIFASMSS